MPVELRHLRYFVAVAEEKHITRAAERLGIQQPPLSQQIGQLERELGAALFVRHPKGVALTAAGTAYLGEARFILARCDSAAGLAQRTAQGLEGVLSLGFTGSAVTHPVCAQWIRHYHQAFPRVDLRMVEGNAAELTEKLLAQQLDVAILREPVLRPPELVFQEILHEEMLAVLPGDHPLVAGKAEKPGKAGAGKTISLKDLAADPFILVRRPGAPGMYANLIMVCEQLGFTPQIAAEVDRMLSNISLVAAGQGVSVIPASMAHFCPESVVCVRLAEASKLKAPLTLAWRRNHASAAAAHFVDMDRAALQAALSATDTAKPGKKR